MTFKIVDEVTGFQEATDVVSGLCQRGSEKEDTIWNAYMWKQMKYENVMLFAATWWCFNSVILKLQIQL